MHGVLSNKFLDIHQNADTQSVGAEHSVIGDSCSVVDIHVAAATVVAFAVAAATSATCQRLKGNCGNMSAHPRDDAVDTLQ